MYTVKSVFEKEANLELTSKQAIVLKPNTRLSPNSESSFHLKIDATLQAACELQLRDPSIEE